MPCTRPQGESRVVFGSEFIRVVTELHGKACGWNAVAEFRSHGGRPLLTRLVIEPTKPKAYPLEVSHDVLRGVSLLPMYRALSQAPLPGRQFIGLADDFEETLPTGRPGRPGRPPAEYALWAARYVAAVQRGSHKPVADLAAEFGEEHRTVKHLVNRAREKGLLTGGQQGRFGGELSPEALRLLDSRGASAEPKTGTATKQRDLIRERVEAARGEAALLEAAKRKGKR